MQELLTVSIHSGQVVDCPDTLMVKLTREPLLTVVIPIGQLNCPDTPDGEVDGEPNRLYRPRLRTSRRLS